MWFNNKFFKFTTGLILVLIVIFLLGKIDFFWDPFRKFIAVLFLPIMISGILYYILRPPVRFLQKHRVPHTLAIVIVFVFSLLAVVLIGTYSGSIIAKQANQLVNDSQHIVYSLMDQYSKMIDNKYFDFAPLNKYEQQLTAFAEKTLSILGSFLGGSFWGVLSTITNITTIVLIVPFILFYFLKDDTVFVSYFLNVIPKKHKQNVKHILEEIDRMLSMYITGQVVVGLIISILMYIGYLIIGVRNYTLILAIFVFITSFIPIFGAFIGIIPALLVSIGEGPFMILKIILVMFVVQQLQGNVFSPIIMGKSMDIHPLTFILLFLVAASMFGLIGMIIAVPLYAVLKIVAVNVKKMYELKQL